MMDFARLGSAVYRSESGRMEFIGHISRGMHSSTCCGNLAYLGRSRGWLNQVTIYNIPPRCGKAQLSLSFCRPKTPPLPTG